MDVLVFILYKMGISQAPSVSSKMVFQNSCTSPLGSIKLAGRIEQSLGKDQGRQRRLEAYALVYSLEGKCNYWDEVIGHRHLGPGDMIILFPGVAHRYGAGADRNWSEFFIVFEGPLFDVWRDRGLISPTRPVFHLAPVAFWEKRLAACLEGRESNGRETALRQVCRLQSLLGEITGSAGGDGSRGPVWIDRACAMLGSVEAQSMNLAQMAHSLGVSFETFRKTFAEKTGLSPGRYRSARLMDEACDLMLRSQLSGKEIADELGFFDEYHFSKRFKKVTGFSPTAFRRWVRGT